MKRTLRAIVALASIEFESYGFIIHKQVESHVSVRRCEKDELWIVQSSSSLIDDVEEIREEENNNRYDIIPASFSGFMDYEEEEDFNSILGDIEEVDGEEEVGTALMGNTFLREESSILDELEDRFFLNEERQESCILVGVEDLSEFKRKRAKDTSSAAVVYFNLEESMVEMRELIKTAGLTIVGEVTQRLNEANPRTYIGTGKVKEVTKLAKSSQCTTVVFDAEMSPRQQKALENAFNSKLIQNDFNLADSLEIKVIDRTALILDIFAQHAKTREGKLQVDLALHEYRKPRLTKMWTHLERQSGAGGVGLRGPGELQLEMDKRIINDRIIRLKHKINNIQKQRQLHRRKRSNTKMKLPILSLVGYTNAGKSSLLNFLTRAGVLSENILFATLDPTTRRVKLPGYKTHPEVLLTDTVGFIQKLPTHLIAAFRATLEEVHEADVIVHVIDVSHSAWMKQEASVKQVLQEIEVSNDKPIIRVFNKIDLLDPHVAEELKYEVAFLDTPTVAISALTGEGMEDFVAVVEETLGDLLMHIEVLIPYQKGDELNLIHEVGNVDTVDYRTTGTYVSARVPKSLAMRLSHYQVQELGKQFNDKHKEDEEDWAAIGRGRHNA